MLTAKQSKVLAYIDGYIKSNGFAPSYDNLCADMGFPSRGNAANFINRNGFAPSYDNLCADMGFQSRVNAANFINRIIERGYIRRIPGKARAMEVIKAPPVKNTIAEGECCPLCKRSS